MKISVETEVGDRKIPEWGMIEFQGSFSCVENEDKAFFNGYIGDLNYTKDGTPFFINGHHILYGQEVSLQRPFAILFKNFENGDYSAQYLVKAIIRKKIIFKTRPKPIIPYEVLITNS